MFKMTKKTKQRSIVAVIGTVIGATVATVVGKTIMEGGIFILTAAAVGGATVAVYKIATAPIRKLV